MNFKISVLVLTLALAQVVPITLYASEPSNSIKKHADKDKDPEQYYRDIGRDDIADEYSSRKTKKVLGIVSMGIGSLFLLKSASTFVVVDSTYSSLLVFGLLGVVAVGGGIYLASLPSDPFTPEELRALEQQAAHWTTPQLGLQFRF